MKKNTKTKKGKPLVGPMKPRVESELFEVRAHEDASDSWRIFKIISEFVDGFDLLRKHERAATIFGSTRSRLGDTLYRDAMELAAKISKAGFTIITGGGGGVMEAANKGARNAGGQSIGLNITLPTEQELNAYTTKSMAFRYFFTRKVMLTFASEVYIYFPGGFGTLDEFFEITTLVQTEKIDPIPVVLVGKEYWEPLIRWFEASLYKKHRTIDEQDLKIYHLVDSVDEAYDLIIDLVNERCKKKDIC